MRYSRWEIGLRAAILLVILLLLAFTLYLYGPSNILSLSRLTDDDLETLQQPAEEKEYTLTYPLTAPYILRQEYSSAQLEKHIPSGCPGLPWRRNLKKYPIMIQGRPSGQFTHEGNRLEGCPWPCVFVSERNQSEVDALYFDLFTSMLRPGVPIYDHHTYGEGNRRICPMQRYVFNSMEADSYYAVVGNPRAPEFGFDIGMTYKLESEVPTVYFSDVAYNFFQEPPSFEEKNETEAYASAFISNCHPTNDRYTYQEAIQKLIKVDSYGSCHNTATSPGSVTSRWNFKQDTLRKYLFTLAFENSNTKDYVTEKMYQALVAGTVPVYIGAPNVDELVPFKDGIIKASDFGSAEELVNYLKYLRQNQTAYDSYMAWKFRSPEDIGEPFKTLLKKNHVDANCRLCGFLAGENVGW